MDEATLKVVRAWLYPGVNPGYHQRKMDELRRDWPVLARALDELTEYALSGGEETK